MPEEILETQQPATSSAVTELVRGLEGFEIVEAQHDRFRRAYDPHQIWAAKAKECVDFFEGAQWTEAERETLAKEKRPCLTKNKIAPLARVLFGYHRQNKYELKYLPGNDGSGTQAIAEALTATSKQIDEKNQSEWNDAQVFQDGIQTGRGFWDQRLDFAENYMGDIRERVVDPFTVYLDPEADTYKPEGWNYVIESRWLSPLDIYVYYGPQALELATTQGYSLPITGGGYIGYLNDEIKPASFFGLDDFWTRGWGAVGAENLSPYHYINRARKLIRVLDCQHRQMKQVRYFVDLETGQEKVIPDTMPPEKIQRIMQFAMARNLPLDMRTGLKSQIRWTTTAGDRVLWDKWSPYENFTITPYFPYFRRGKTKSPIEDLIDPQREINKRSSSFLHIIMSTANSGWIYPEHSLSEDMKRALEEEGARPGIHVEYNSQYDAPRRISPEMAPQALKQLEMDSTADLKEISGINDSALGQLDQVQSGRAILARQKQSVIGAETYFDNFSRSREIKGEVRLGIIQQYYTEARTFRVRSEGGDQSEVQINMRNAAGEIENNVTLGRYQIAIDEAPISATFMQGQLQEAMELREMGVPIPDDILISMSSMPFKQEIKQRLDEQRMLNDDIAKTNSLLMKGQAGLPPDMPVPPVVVVPEVAIDASQLPPQPIAPPQGQPMPVPQQPILPQ